MTDRLDRDQPEAVREHASADAAPELFGPADAPRAADRTLAER